MRMAESPGKALLHRNEERGETPPARALWIPRPGGREAGHGEKGDRIAFYLFLGGEGE